VSYDEEVARLGVLDRHGPAEHVRAVEVDVADVVGVVGVDDLRIRPLAALHAGLAARVHRRRRRDVGVPPVVPGHRLLGPRL
jgi:hypothetical protein